LQTIKVNGDSYVRMHSVVSWQV